MQSSPVFAPRPASCLQQDACSRCAVAQLLLTSATSASAAQPSESFLALNARCRMPLLPRMTAFMRNSAAFLYLSGPLGNVRSYSSKNLYVVWEFRRSEKHAVHICLSTVCLQLCLCNESCGQGNKTAGARQISRASTLYSTDVCQEKQLLN